MTIISNVSSSFEETSTDYFIRVAWLTFVFVFGTFGNLLLFAVILRKGRITNVTNLFNLNLAVGDLIRIFVFIPVYLVYSSEGQWPKLLGLAGCKGIFMVIQSSSTVSIVTLMFMSMERYQAVVHPLKKQMTIHVARYLVIVSWVLGLFTSVWYAMSIKLDTNRRGHLSCHAASKESWMTATLLLLIIGTQWLPGVVFMVAYIKIILKLRRDSVINPFDVSQSSQNRHRRNRRAACILVIEVLLFLCCLYPFYQNSLAWIFGSNAALDPLSVQGTLVYCMMMTYSLINPFCHILLNSEFRGEIVKMTHQLKVCCHLERNHVGHCSHCHLPAWHLHHEETRNNAERTNTITEL